MTSYDLLLKSRELAKIAKRMAAKRKSANQQKTKSLDGAK